MSEWDNGSSSFDPQPQQNRNRSVSGGWDVLLTIIALVATGAAASDPFYSSDSW